MTVKVPLREKESGSALLVVLGFLSFMVISAVAFAIYMRSERVPSSALRRNVATRHLVRAALAQAMSRVDDAIRNDPFPGLAATNGPGPRADNDYHDANYNAMDFWYGRVFMPPDPEGSTKPDEEVDSNSGISATRFAPITETVSTLTLEGLGYLPPALVNDVRFLSRSTWTAKWQNFPYDAGRFAFCAVNVSDYFDINRATTGVRTSAPDSRISLAYLLRTGDALDSINTATANTFSDNFGPNAAARQTDSGIQATVPYVSMLDYNLALGSKFSGGLNNVIRSFFWWWLDGGTGKRYFYDNGASSSDPGVKQAARQTFVTDSWSTDLGSATMTNANRIAYLQSLKEGDEYGQPFSSAFLKNGSLTALELINKGLSGSWLDKTKRTFQPEENLTLFDYLDGNDYPMSLAFPCVERVPMVVAIGPRNLALTLNFKEVSGGEKQVGDTIRYVIKNYVVDGDILGGALETLLAFPFRRGKDFPKSGYSAQAIVRVIMGADGFETLRANGAAANLRPQKADWDSQPECFSMNGSAVRAFVVTARSDPEGVALPANVKDENDAVFPTPFTFSGVRSELPIFQVAEEQRKSGAEEGGTATWTSTGNKLYNIAVDMFTAEGELMGLPRGDDPSQWRQASELAGLGPFVPYVSVWVRVTKDGTAVDYVPAVFDDDLDQLQVDNSQLKMVDTFCWDGHTAGTPLLKWKGGSGSTLLFSVTPANYTCSDWTPKSYFAVDPRFNWAPEDWVQMTTAVSENDWLNLVDTLLGQNGRDSDPFLFVSNQGYLQSVGELAFLPRLSDLDGSQLLRVGGSYDGVARTTPTDIVNADCAWTSYRPFAMSGATSDRLFHRDIVDGTGSVTVNPYTDNAEIRLAAFANTPYDWWAAGTNWDQSTVDGDATAAYFSKKNYVKNDNVEESLKYAFTDTKSDVKLTYDDVRKISRVICDTIRANPGVSWENVYDNMIDWAGDPNNPNQFGVVGGQDFVSLSSPLYGDDRKFLYAYWRNCFANKQQLFLIFVRAESTALGGPGEGTPAQQGGRAVALVWREPQSNTVDGNTQGVTDDQQITYQANGRRRPHRMRVLFYHQFD